MTALCLSLSRPTTYLPLLLWTGTKVKNMKHLVALVAGTQGEEITVDFECGKASAMRAHVVFETAEAKACEVGTHDCTPPFSLVCVNFSPGTLFIHTDDGLAGGDPGAEQGADLVLAGAARMNAGEGAGVCVQCTGSQTKLHCALQGRGCGR